MRRLGRLKNWTARNWRNKVKPVLADGWYAVRTGGLKCFAPKERDRKDLLTLTKEDLEEVRQHKGIVHHEKPLSTYDQDEVVRFLRKEITLGDSKERRICRLCEEREVDGAALVSATNEELMELGFDGVLARKLKMKIEDHGRDRTAEFKIEELRIFLKRCELPQYRDRLINDLGVFDVDELPSLISNKQWVRSLRMRVDEELKFKIAVRQFAADKVAAERARMKSLGIVEKETKRKVKLTKDGSASLKMHAREDLNSAITNQGLADLELGRKGNPQWFKDIPPATPQREKGLGYMKSLRAVQGLHKGAKSTIPMGDDNVAVSGNRKAKQRLPPGHRVDETIALLAPRRNRV